MGGWVTHLFHVASTEVGGTWLEEARCGGSLIHLAPWQGQLGGRAQLVLSSRALTGASPAWQPQRS